MAEAGWYPDPSGTPGRLRYFDGTTWTGEVIAESGTSTGGGGRAGLFALVVGVLVLGLIVWWVFRPGGGGGVPEDTNSSSPTISAWDETSSPSSAPPTPTTQPTDTGGRPTECPPDTLDVNTDQPRDGRYTGGGLSFAEVPGWNDSGGWGLDWASDRSGQVNNVTTTWYAMAAVGEIDRGTFPNPQSATNQLMQCMATSYYFEGFTGRTDLLSEAVTIDGKGGWKLVSEVRVAQRPDGVSGDVVTVIVVDVGREGKLAVFLSQAPIGDADRNQLANAAADGLQVRP